MESRESDATRGEEPISTPTGVSGCVGMWKADETVACCSSGNSAVEIQSGLSNDDELWVDKEDRVGQLVGDTPEQEKRLPVLMGTVLEATEKIEQMELVATNERSANWKEEVTNGTVVGSFNAEEQMESRALIEHELAVMWVMPEVMMEGCLTFGRKEKRDGGKNGPLDAEGFTPMQF